MLSSTWNLIFCLITRVAAIDHLQGETSHPAAVAGPGRAPPGAAPAVSVLLQQAVLPLVLLD